MARQQAENGLTIAEREQGRVTEQRWLRFARLYELMDEVLPIVDPKITQPGTSSRPTSFRPTINAELAYRVVRYSAVAARS